MSAIIPLSSAGNGTTPVGTGGVLIPFRLGGIAATPRVSLEAQALRAVAGAVALKGAADSMQVSQNSRSDPAAVIRTITPDGGVLKPVLQAIRAAQKNRAAAATPPEEHRRVAEAIGADPVLVTAAHGALADTAVEEARALVAASDAELLARAARAAAVRQQFLRAEAQTPPPTDVQRLEAELASVQQKLAAMERRLDALPAPATGTPAGTQGPSYPAAKGAKVQVPSPAQGSSGKEADTPVQVASK